MVNLNKICASALLSAALFSLPLGMTSAVNAAESEDMVLQRGTQPGRLDFSEPLPLQERNRDKTTSATNGSNGPEVLIASSAAPVSASTGSALRTAGMCLIFLGGAAGLMILYYRRRNGITGAAGAGRRMEILEKISLGPQREILLLRACDRLLLLGSQGGQFTMLSDLPTDNSPSQPFNDLVAGELPDELAAIYASPARAAQAYQPPPPQTYQPPPRQVPPQTQQADHMPKQVPGDFYSAAARALLKPIATTSRPTAQAPAQPTKKSTHATQTTHAEAASIVDSIQLSVAAAQAWPDLEPAR